MKDDYALRADESDITQIDITYTDSGWEIVEWYGNECCADDLFDTKAEAIKVARRIFNDNPSVRTLRADNGSRFDTEFSIIRKRGDET
tara:strand:- start:817 stop:1080 length:264 start_codon:yes stop_codon:yes gene_type:complete